jgi:hypothetical protein
MPVQRQQAKRLSLDQAVMISVEVKRDWGAGARARAPPAALDGMQIQPVVNGFASRIKSGARTKACKRLKAVDSEKSCFVTSLLQV